MKRDQAYKIAIQCIEIRQKKFAVLSLEWQRGWSMDEKAKRAHKNWCKLEEAKKVMARELDIKHQLTFGMED